MRRIACVAGLAAGLLILGGCATSTEPGSPSLATTASAESSQPTTPPASTLPDAPETSPEEVAPPIQSSAPTPIRTSTWQAPPTSTRQAAPVIERCGLDGYERGTTFYTDGTTNWSAECAAQHDAALGRATPPTNPNAGMDFGPCQDEGQYWTSVDGLMKCDGGRALVQP